MRYLRSDRPAAGAFGGVGPGACVPWPDPIGGCPQVVWVDVFRWNRRPCDSPVSEMRSFGLVIFPVTLYVHVAITIPFRAIFRP